MIARARVLVEQAVAGCVMSHPLLQQFESLVFADGNEFHLGRDDALARIPELGDRMTLARAKRLALPACQSREFQEAIAPGLAGIFSVLAGKVTVVLRSHFASVVCLNVAAS